MFKINYNPDVLSCLANLSNDEVRPQDPLIFQWDAVLFIWTGQMFLVTSGNKKGPENRAFHSNL